MDLYFHELAIGRIGIAEQQGSITNLYFESDTIPPDAQITETDLIKEAFRQLQEYFAGDLKSFSLPLAPHGTDFMQKVWKNLCLIPYGHTASYKEIASASGNPKACRAVGFANNKNPLPLFIPCHRVIGSDGKPVGYRGGLEVKLQLLDLEKRHKDMPG
jgi:methylated-DNA-[protein]-cysteine S-methyltransferase